MFKGSLKKYLFEEKKLFYYTRVFHILQSVDKDGKNVI